MRRTGSRESRESRDASATSPTSIAVKTFSIRFGSRRNQRPDHQKIRSITTVSPIIDTIRIGHMMGPPLRKLSIKKLELSPLGLVAASPGDALSVAVTVAPGGAGAPGGGPGGDCCGGAGGAGDCAREVSARASEDMQTVSNVFIVEAEEFG